MEDELRENLSAAMEQAVNDIGLQGKTRREKHVNDINILQEGKLLNFIIIIVCKGTVLELVAENNSLCIYLLE